MKKFIAIYNAPAAVMAQNANMTKEDMEKGMQAWFAWKAQNEKHIVDFGAPLMPGQSTIKGGGWNPINSQTAGYSILQAESLDEIKATFANHPHLNWGEGCTIALHEFAPM